MYYAKLPVGATESAIHTVTQPDDYHTAEELLAEGWLPLHYEERPSEDPTRGYAWSPIYRIEDAQTGRIVRQVWIQIPDPPMPRTFSKFRLKLAIANAGFLSDFEEMLGQVEVLPGYSGAAAFADAMTLDEDHPKFVAAVALAKQEFGLTDEQVEAILAASVAEG